MYSGQTDGDINPGGLGNLVSSSRLKQELTLGHLQRPIARYGPNHRESNTSPRRILTGLSHYTPFFVCPILCEIECIKFVCKEFVLVFVQIDLIQFEFSNCISSICTKTNTNLLHTNLIHSISHKTHTILRKIGHVIQIVVHQFVHKTSAKKNLKSEKNWSPFLHRYAGICRISTKEKKIDPL